MSLDGILSVTYTLRKLICFQRNFGDEVEWRNGGQERLRARDRKKEIKKDIKLTINMFVDILEMPKSIII